VVSADKASVEGEDEETRRQRHHRNDLRAKRRKNEATIAQTEADLQTAD
jgi:hypothetical protein